ncbi:MAG: NADH-quinone oxidoreductase subunit J [Opitutales bacterium]|jgi:NADH-quinone oxidoreductase subunit J
MKEILFHCFAALTIVPAFFVATCRKPVNAAMNMLVSFVGLAGLFVLLETYFLAVLQVMVYAGAIVVLFLFIIMLIDADRSPAPKLVRFLASLAAFALLAVGGYYLVFGCGSGPYPDITAAAPGSLSRTFGVELFTKYLLPFQMTGFMLLIAMVGVIVVSRKHEPESTGGEQ